MRLPLFARSSPLWSILFIAWFITLWCLSSKPLPGPKAPDILPIDKILHFGYFFGGGGLLSAAIFLRKRSVIHWSSVHLLVVLTLFAVGSLDEWHQSWYPFRSGNDAGDLSADILGALAGTLVFRALYPKLFGESQT